MPSILIAEDDTAVRAFVRRALAQAGHDVTEVSDGMEALEMLAERRFDLLLSDIVMPELDGIALALKVAKDHPGMPILLMTGYVAERQRAYNLDALIHTVIAKPFTLKQVCDAVADALSGVRGQASPAGQLSRANHD